MDLVSQNLLMTSGGKKDSTYVDDVFSTYLYAGNGDTQAISNGIKLSNDNAGDSVQFVASSSQYLKVPQHSSLELGTGDYCIECWVRPTRSGSPNEGIWTYGSYDGNGGMLAWIHGNELKIFCARTNANICQVSNWRQQNVWTHLAVTRYSGTTKTFSNGVEIATSTEQNNDNVGEAANNMNQFFLGCERNNTNNIGGFFEGNISNMRIVKGSAVYTSNFTPPTKALTSTTNTLVLFCQSSTSAITATKTPITITSNGDPTAIGFGPFTADDGEGGMVWFKSRSAAHWHSIFDTVRGANKSIYPNSTWQQESLSNTLNSFNNNGFTVGYNSSYSSVFTNANNDDYSSWTFRKAPGFFDVVTYTGTGSGAGSPQTIEHSLKSIPGMIIIKNLTQASQWFVYHVGIGEDKFLQLNKNDAAIGYNGGFKNITSSSVGVFDSNSTNTNEYIAYFFAGGASTAATARSVAFTSGSSSNQNAQSLTIANSSDTDFGSGDFTMECWFKDTRNSDWSDLDTIFSMSGYTNSSNNDSFSIYQAQGGFVIFNRTGGGFDMVVDSRTNVSEVGQWHHFAWTRSGSGTNNNKIWLDGNLHAQFTRNVTYADGQDFYIGGNQYSGGGTPNEYGFNGKISNVRITKGQVVYTSVFKPPIEPLTTTSQGANSSNVKVICCNNSSITGSSLTSGTITSTNSPTASTESPFDDLEGYKFGENEDQNIIKMGSYVGNNSSTVGPEINLGWEPSFLLIKESSGSGDWTIFDSMRGISTGGSTAGGGDNYLHPNLPDGETTGNQRVDLTSTGFNLRGTWNFANENAETYVYMAIRRPDGLVGKPVEVGTDVFAMDVGNSNSTQAFDSAFPVDFALTTVPTQTMNWEVGARLIQGKYIYTDTTAAEASQSYFTFDSNTGWLSSNYSSIFQSWMWKRHAGFDVVTYTGNESANKTINHSLGKTPEMIWVKRRESPQSWGVYHKGLNGGSSPEDYYLLLDTNDAQVNSATAWNSQAPTSTRFFVGSSSLTNSNIEPHLAMLFASVDGVSKVGGYTGNGAATQVITTGFQPRFIIIRRTASGGNWHVFDTVRGWTAGNDNQMALNNAAAQNNSYNYIGPPTATGFSVSEPGGEMNMNGTDYIYYAHA